MLHFLLIYDIERGQLVGDPQVFEVPDSAVEAYMRAETTLRDRKDIQVVLVASDSLESVKVTHGNFFKRESIEDFITGMFMPGGMIQ